METKYTVLFYKIDKTYGGSDYIEVDFDNKIFGTGNTRYHYGNFGNSIDVEVKTQKSMQALGNDLLRREFKQVGNVLEYNNKNKKEL